MSVTSIILALLLLLTIALVLYIFSKVKKLIVFVFFVSCILYVMSVFGWIEVSPKFATKIDDGIHLVFVAFKPFARGIKAIILNEGESGANTTDDITSQVENQIGNMTNGAKKVEQNVEKAKENVEEAVEEVVKNAERLNTERVALEKETEGFFDKAKQKSKSVFSSSKNYLIDLNETIMEKLNLGEAKKKTDTSSY